MTTRRRFLRSSLAVGITMELSLPAWARNPRGQVAPTNGIVFDLFMSPNGDDILGTGTLANPYSITALSKYATINYAGKKIGLIGDVAGVQTPFVHGTSNGVQTTLVSLVNANVCYLTVNGGSSSANPTYIASCNSSGVYTRGWAIIDAGNPTTDGNALMGWSKFATLPPNQDNVTYDGLTVRNFNYAGISIVCTARAQNCIVKNCEFYGCNNASTSNNPGAVRQDDTNNTQIINCKFHDCAATSGGFPPAYPGIMSYNSTALTVTNCSFYNMDSIQQKDANQDATISYCYLDCGTFGVHSGQFYGSYYEGITGAGRTTTIHHCILLGPVYLSGGSPANYSGNYNFYNNTCPLVGAEMPIFYQQQPNAGGTFNAYNNVFYQQSGSWTAGSYGIGKLTGANSTTIPTWDYNYYLTGPQFCPSGNGGTLISYASWQALGFDAHSHTGGSPFSGTPTAQVPSSLALNVASAAYTGGVGGVICGAIDGSGSVGCSF